MGITWTGVVKFFAWVTAGCAAFIASFDVSLKILLILMSLDIVTGFIRALIRKNLSSDDAWRGIGRKVLIVIIIVMTYIAAQMLDKTVGYPLIVAVTGFYCYKEFISALENASAAGVPVPQFLKDALVKLNPDKFQTPGGDSTPPVLPPDSWTP